MKVINVLFTKFSNTKLLIINEWYLLFSLKSCISFTARPNKPPVSETENRNLTNFTTNIDIFKKIFSSIEWKSMCVLACVFVPMLTYIYYVKCGTILKYAIKTEQHIQF